MSYLRQIFTFLRGHLHFFFIYSSRLWRTCLRNTLYILSSCEGRFIRLVLRYTSLQREWKTMTLFMFCLYFTCLTMAAANDLWRLPCPDNASLTMFYRRPHYHDAEERDATSLFSDAFLGFGFQLLKQFADVCQMDYNIKEEDSGNSTHRLSLMRETSEKHGSSAVDMSLDILSADNLRNFQLSQPVAIFPGILVYHVKEEKEAFNTSFISMYFSVFVVVLLVGSRFFVGD